MKKKFLLIGATTALAGFAALSLGSCGSDGDTWVTAGDNGSLDILLNYAGTGGITRVKDSTFDPITDAQITPGALLPSWKAFASYTGTSLRDASSYTESDDAGVWDAVAKGDAIMSQTDDSQNVDLIYNATSKFKSNVAKLTSLNEYLGLDEDGNEVEGKEVVMKHFKAWLEKNPTYKRSLKISNNYYFTPYFDGYNDIERMLIMDTSMTTAVLDDENAAFDETTTNGGATPSNNVVQQAAYQPFVDANYNYATAPTVKVLAGSTVKDVALVKTDNIIKQQNQLLATGCTGKQLAKQLINYIKTAAANLFSDGTYTKVSDFYTSSAAAYNADDLVALMRVVKANPGLITGDANVEIETFFPRAASNNRIENIFDLSQIWGVQGVDGEQNNFYFAGDGKIHSVETTQASYDALTYLSQMYDEGLILKDFYTNSAGKADKTGYLDILYKKTTAASGTSNYGFMMYDYSAANCAANTMVDGVGTKNSARITGFKDQDITGITAVLPPLTYWATESNWSHSQAINDFTGKTLNRYYESNRALKTNSWAIPKNSDNAKGAAIMMDFMFSQLGALIQDYGPTNYWADPDTTTQALEKIKFDVNGDVVDGGEIMAEGYVSTTLVSGEYNAIINPYVKSSLGNSGTDFWTYMRNWLGSTHGIGHVRSAGVNIQATNAYAQWGCLNVANAFKTDSVLKLAQVDKFADFTWDSSVPTGYVSVYSDDSYKYGSLTGFWSASKQISNDGWVSVVTSAWNAPKTSLNIIDAQKGKTTYQQVLDDFDNFNNYALWTYANSVGTNYIPAYANGQA